MVWTAVASALLLLVSCGAAVWGLANRDWFIIATAGVVALWALTLAVLSWRE